MRACDIDQGTTNVRTFRLVPSTRPDGEGDTKSIGTVDLCAGCIAAMKEQGVAEGLALRSSMLRASSQTPPVLRHAADAS